MKKKGLFWNTKFGKFGESRGILSFYKGATPPELELMGRGWMHDVERGSKLGDLGSYTAHRGTRTLPAGARDGTRGAPYRPEWSTDVRLPRPVRYGNSCTGMRA